MQGLAGRVAQAADEPMDIAPSDSPFDRALRFFDRYFLVERAAGAPVDRLHAALTPVLFTARQPKRSFEERGQQMQQNPFDLSRRNHALFATCDIRRRSLLEIT